MEHLYILTYLHLSNTSNCHLSCCHDGSAAGHTSSEVCLITELCFVMKAQARSDTEIDAIPFTGQDYFLKMNVTVKQKLWDFMILHADEAVMICLGTRNSQGSKQITLWPQIPVLVITNKAGNCTEVLSKNRCLTAHCRHLHLQRWQSGQKHVARTHWQVSVRYVGLLVCRNASK